MGYKCLRCNPFDLLVHKDFGKECSNGGHLGPATANIIFHKVKFKIVRLLSPNFHLI